MLTKSLVDGTMAMGGALTSPSHFIRRRLPRVRMCAAAAAEEGEGAVAGAMARWLNVVNDLSTLGVTGMMIG